MEHYQHNQDENTAAVEIIIARAAREGIPINVIAKILGCGRNRIKRHIQGIFDAGRIIQMPPDNWPDDVRRAPSSEMIYRGYEDQEVARVCHKLGLSVGEGCLLVSLMRRAGQFCSTKELLKSVAKNPDRIRGKLVSVTVCKVRKKLKLFNIMITRKTAMGYMITDDQAQLVQSRIDGES